MTERLNRYKLLKMATSTIIDAFNWNIKDPPEFICLPECDQVPRDAVVDGVYHDFCSDSIILRLYHESFDVVPPGEIPPSIPGVYKARSLPFKDWVKEVLNAT